jgi:hypothetical protein
MIFLIELLWTFSTNTFRLLWIVPTYIFKMANPVTFLGFDIILANLLTFCFYAIVVFVIFKLVTDNRNIISQERYLGLFRVLESIANMVVDKIRERKKEETTSTKEESIDTKEESIREERRTKGKFEKQEKRGREQLEEELQEDKRLAAELPQKTEDRKANITKMPPENRC